MFIEYNKIATHTEEITVYVLTGKTIICLNLRHSDLSHVLIHLNDCSHKHVVLVNACGFISSFITHIWIVKQQYIVATFTMSDNTMIHVNILNMKIIHLKAFMEMYCFRWITTMYMLSFCLIT